MLLDSGVTVLVMSLKFARKKRNMDSTFNHKEPIKHTAEVKLFYKGYKEKIEIDIIEEQKWSVISGIL